LNVRRPRAQSAPRRFSPSRHPAQAEDYTTVAPAGEGFGRFDRTEVYAGHPAAELPRLSVLMPPREDDLFSLDYLLNRRRIVGEN
jgi:hypothetical protein